MKNGETYECFSKVLSIAFKNNPPEDCTVKGQLLKPNTLCKSKKGLLWVCIIHKYLQITTAFTTAGSRRLPKWSLQKEEIESNIQKN